jgi:hypothetical protein
VKQAAGFADYAELIPVLWHLQRVAEQAAGVLEAPKGKRKKTKAAAEPPQVRRAPPSTCWIKVYRQALSLSTTCETGTKWRIKPHGSTPKEKGEGESSSGDQPGAPACDGATSESKMGPDLRHRTGHLARRRSWSTQARGITC